MLSSKGKYSASQIALWFLNHIRLLKNEEDEEYLTNLKLQKLLYYAQGSDLAIKGSPLFNEEIQHWTHGSVVPEIYDTYCANRANPIVYDENFTENIDAETDAILVEVYHTFGQYSAWGLRNLSHSETPWLSTKPHEVIPLNVIQNYFRENCIRERKTQAR